MVNISKKLLLAKNNISHASKGKAIKVESPKNQIDVMILRKLMTQI